jgi:transposase
MAMERMKMKKTREILRLHFDCTLSNQQIADAVRKSKGSVFNCLERFKTFGLQWPLSGNMTDSQLEDKLYPQASGKHNEAILPDFEHIHRELSRPHVTLELLWDEYQTSHHEGLCRSSFYRQYGLYRKDLPIEMKVIHKGGDKLFVDYSGDKLRFYDREAGRWVEAEFFVASWGASSYCYCEAVLSQSGKDWVSSHVRALEYFGCVPAAIVPDNLKSGVTKADFYEPDINALYGQLARHYDTVILPARVRKPKDKAVVESNVLHLQRFIFGRLRDCTFYSLWELNAAVWEALELFNARPMQQYKTSRADRFEVLDKPHAKALPEKRFAFTQVKIDVRVGPNYHIEFEKHYYSVPWEFVRKQVDVYQSGSVLEIYHNNEHICRHMVEPGDYRYTTREEHMPPKHKFVKGWSSAWFIAQAHQVGESTAELIQAILESKRYPEQGFRAALGVLNLKKKYSPERLEKAARRALYFETLSCRSLKSMLAQGLEQEALPKKPHRMPLEHENIRGEHYYSN